MNWEAVGWFALFVYGGGFAVFAFTGLVEEEWDWVLTAPIWPIFYLKYLYRMLRK